MSTAVREDITAAIKRSIDIVELVGEQVRLTRRGRTYKGLCPFHDDHHPSLDVDPERQRFRCWSCGQRGDIFSFVMLRERVEFRQALQMLAERAQIRLPARAASAANSGRKLMWEVLAWAEQQFHRWLLESQQAAGARAYLAQRRLEQGSLRAFRLGFAPNRWDGLLTAARQRGWSPELLHRCGLARQRSDGDGYYDLFRGRLMFPIRDARGRTIAFGGRLLPESEAQAATGPKYLNTPETALFRKGRHLYGLDLARDHIGRSGRAVVVEGYTDCIMAHQHGVANVVGTLGTALGGAHVRELKRFADRIVLVFDGDEAGQRSADRALELFLSQEVDLRVMVLPPGLDPCDYIQEHGAERFRAGLEAAVDAFEFKMQRAERLFDLSSVAGVRQAADYVLRTMVAVPVLTTDNAAVTRENVLDRLAHRLGLPGKVVQKRLHELRRQERHERTPDAATEGAGSPLPPQATTADERLERELLEILLADPSRLPETRQQVAPELFRTPGLRQLYRLCLHLADQGLPVDVDHLRLELEDRELACQVAALAVDGEGKGNFDRRMDDVLYGFQQRRRREEETLMRRRWSAVGEDEQAVKELLTRKYQDSLQRQRRRPGL